MGSDMGRLRTSAFALLGVLAASQLGHAEQLREYLLTRPETSQLGGKTTRPVDGPSAFSLQAANARREHQRPFVFGNRLFNTNWVEAPASVKSFDGLGPLFNRVSCSGCHTKDGRGQPPQNGGGPMDQMLLRISIPGTGPHGAPRTVPGYGDQLSERAINGVDPEGTAKIIYAEFPGTFTDGETFSLRQPTYSITAAAYGPLPHNTMISPRVAPHMIGLGLLENVPQESLLQLADPDDSDHDGISGRVNMVWDAARQKMSVGRFGWKAGQPDLLNQNASAAIGDIGLTTSVHKKENCEEPQLDCNSSISGGLPELDEEFLQKLTLYTASLAVPAQRGTTQQDVATGRSTFRDLGCAACHMPTQQTGNAGSLAELANQTFHPYSDLLLHDMGEGLADGRPEFSASGREWRTPPLWGLGLVPTVNGHENLLHDGRARGFAEAILWHGGEASASRQAFRNAPKAVRDELLAFLRSL